MFSRSYKVNVSLHYHSSNQTDATGVTLGANYQRVGNQTGFSGGVEKTMSFGPFRGTIVTKQVAQFSIVH